MSSNFFNNIYNKKEEEEKKQQNNIFSGQNMFGQQSNQNNQLVPQQSNQLVPQQPQQGGAYKSPFQLARENQANKTGTTFSQGFNSSAPPFGSSNQFGSSGTFGTSNPSTTSSFQSSQNQGSSLFGSSTNTTNVFGNSQNQSSPFGSSQQTSPFGNSPQTSPFGGNKTQSTSSFGSPSQSTSPFGNSNAQQSSPFGTTVQSTSPFGNSSNSFGNTSQVSPVNKQNSFGSMTNQGSSFGSSPFSSNSNTTSTGLFGSQPTSQPSQFGNMTNTFGNTTTPTTSPFTSSQSRFGSPSSAFGSTSGAGTTFGSTAQSTPSWGSQQTNTFNASPQTSSFASTSPFTSTPTQTTSPFTTASPFTTNTQTTSPFSTATQPSPFISTPSTSPFTPSNASNKVDYKKTTVRDTVGNSNYINHICAMDQYKNREADELRNEFYKTKTPQSSFITQPTQPLQQTTPSPIQTPFNTQQTQPLSPQPISFPQPTMFNQPQQQPQFTQPDTSDPYLSSKLSFKMIEPVTISNLDFPTKRIFDSKKPREIGLNLSYNRNEEEIELPSKKSKVIENATVIWHGKFKVVFKEPIERENYTIQNIKRALRVDNKKLICKDYKGTGLNKAAHVYLYNIYPYMKSENVHIKKVTSVNEQIFVQRFEKHLKDIADVFFISYTVDGGIYEYETKNLSE